MPSVARALTASLSLGSLRSSLPQSVSFSSPITGAQLLGHFSGWTATLSAPDLAGSDAAALASLTVFSPPKGEDKLEVSCDWVKDQVASYADADDVFDVSFLQVVYLQGKGPVPEAGLAECLAAAFDTQLLLSGATTTTAGKFKNRSAISAVSAGNSSSSSVPNGPYVAHISGDELTLGPVYRVYADDHQAFMNGILPNGTDGRFGYAAVNTVSDSTIGIPVPSRLYYGNSLSNSSGGAAANGTDAPAASRKPLSGVRVTIKDIVDIAGIKTTNGNRAWASLYPVLESTSPAVETLRDLGAVVIGKTKTAQFANSDRPTADWVDYHDAFSPRGDGYQDPGVSSAGAGAASAAYDWVDVSVGTDTGGSVRIPAAKNGLFAIRPSFGALSNEGVMPEGEFFDSVGFLTRSPRTLQSFGRAWLGAAEHHANLTLSANHTGFPRKLFVPSNLWPVENPAAQRVFEEWIGKLAAHLGGADISTKPVDEFWNETAHADEPGTNFWDHMQQVAFNLNWKHQVEVVIEPFEADYAAANGGRSPFINPFPAARYASAANITDEMVAESYRRFTYFRNWFGREVVRPDRSTCSDSLYLIPMAAGETAYRNGVYSPPDVSSWASFLKYYYSVQSQGPEVVFPIGQVAYNSTISGVEEQLPIAIDVLAHRGCDLMLLDLARDLADAGLLKEVKTGRTAF